MAEKDRGKDEAPLPADREMPHPERCDPRRPDYAEIIARHTAALAAGIEDYWLEPEHQAARSWRAHLDIDAIMLATSLLPDGFLTV